jgi:hypothetical protein
MGNVSFLNQHKELLAALLAAIFFVALYLTDLSLNQDEGSAGSEIGTIQFADPEVSRRPHNRTLWLPVTKDIKVFEKDTLRTGPSSQTTILLKSQGTITLRPDSLAILETDNREFKVHLADGDLFLSGEVTAQVGDTKIQGTRGSQVAIQKGHFDGKIKVTSKEGAAMVSRRGGQAQTLSQGQEIETQDKTQKIEIQTFSYNSIKPDTVNPLLSDMDKHILVEFEVATIPGSTELQNRTLQVFVNQKSKKPIINLEVPDGQNAFSARVPRAGEYYWTMKSQNKVAMPLSRFEVQFIPKPKSIEMKDLAAPDRPLVEVVKDNPLKARITFKNIDTLNDGPLGMPEKIEINWKSTSKIETFTFRPVEKSELEIESKQIAMNAGRIELRYIYKNDLKSEWREYEFEKDLFSYFEVITEKPTLIYPPDQRSILESRIRNGGLRFEWNEVGNKHFFPKEYILEIREKSKIVKELRTKSNSVVLSENLNPGKYSWTIRAEWPNSSETILSDARIFEIKKPKADVESQVIRAPAFVGEE